LSRATLGGAVIAIAVIAGIVFIGVAVHELNYASGHPYAYGPAKVIAWGGGAGALACVAIALIGYSLTGSDIRS
jgi:hypothetical protein